MSPLFRRNSDPSSLERPNLAAHRRKADKGVKAAKVIIRRSINRAVFCYNHGFTNPYVYTLTFKQLSTMHQPSVDAAIERLEEACGQMEDDRVELIEVYSPTLGVTPRLVIHLKLDAA